MKLLLGLLLAGGLYGQALPPQVFIGGGVSYSTITSPKVNAWTTVAVQTVPSIYSVTAVESTKAGTSARTGLAHYIYRGSAFSYLGYVDGGLTVKQATAGAAASFSAGVVAAYKIPKLKYTYAVGIVRLVVITSTEVKPVYEFGVGWAF